MSADRSSPAKSSRTSGADAAAPAEAEEKATPSPDVPAVTGETPDPAAPAADDDEPRLSRERLLTPEGAGWVGVPLHELVGALHNSRGKQFTREQARGAHARWLDREVDVAEGATIPTAAQED